MRLIACLIISICLLYVSASSINQCPEGAMMKCSTTHVEEVCGIVQVGKQQIRANFYNHCLACMVGKVNFSVSGKCEQFEQDAYICSPSDKARNSCTEEYNAVCAYFGEDVKCKKAPCASEYSNKCYACQDKKVSFYKKGSCKNE